LLIGFEPTFAILFTRECQVMPPLNEHLCPPTFLMPRVERSGGPPNAQIIVAGTQYGARVGLETKKSPDGSMHLRERAGVLFPGMPVRLRRPRGGLAKCRAAHHKTGDFE
jgi:hypothetical protein